MAAEPGKEIIKKYNLTRCGGKGGPAALFMVIAKTLIKNAAQMGLSPKAVLEKVNNQLCENNEAEMFVTVWLRRQI